jgi:hypothetical protein
MYLINNGKILKDFFRKGSMKFNLSEALPPPR